MKKIIYLFLAWRILLFAVSYFAPSILPANFGKSFPYWEELLAQSQLPHFIWSFGNFDGVHYLGIAKNAYAYQYTQVFFPLYPILIKLVSYLTLGNLIIAALFISNLAFLAGLLIFYRLLLQTQGEKTAYWACIFLLVFPTSFYFGAVYTEGLFFLMAVASFYLAYRKKIWQAAVIGAFSSATRLIGLFLTPFLVMPKKPKTYLYALIVPLGFLAYVLYLKVQFNSPFYFLSAQSVFGQERETTTVILLPQVVFRYLKIILTTEGLPQITAVFELASTLLALMLLLVAFIKINRRWAAFGLAAVIIPTLTGTFASMPRYILVAFPIYIVLAHVKSTAIKIVLLFASSALLIYFTALFTQGYWVA